MLEHKLQRELRIFSPFQFILSLQSYALSVPFPHVTKVLNLLSLLVLRAVPAAEDSRTQSG